MEYFQTPLPRYLEGSCSDNECPCNDTRIPVGEGYLYIPFDCCAFRWDCRKTAEAHTKAERLLKERGIILGPGVAVPILVCEVGARKRRLDLAIAARDAKHWWATEQVPFRPTPRVGEPEAAFTGQAATSQTSDPFIREVRAPPPSGQPSNQTPRNKPLVHLLVLKEGIAPPPSDVKELFLSLETDVRADSPTSSSSTINTWPENPEDVALALLARDYNKYLNKEYDVRTDQLRHKDGTRMAIVKVFANRPKIVGLNKPLVHVLALKEGTELSGSALEELLRSDAPEVFENSPRPNIEFIYTGEKWPEDPLGLAWAFLAKNHDEYVSKEYLVREEYDVRANELRQSDGTRVLILKVFANRPKIVDPRASAQQTNMVDAPASAQKKNSGWLSKVRSLFDG